MGYQIVTMTSRDLQRCCEAVRSAILATAWLLVHKTNRFESMVDSNGDSTCPAGQLPDADVDSWHCFVLLDVKH